MHVCFITLDTETVVPDEDGMVTHDIDNLLCTHVYDLDVGIMRGIISAAAAPPDSLSSKNIINLCFYIF